MLMKQVLTIDLSLRAKIISISLNGMNTICFGSLRKYVEVCWETNIDTKMHLKSSALKNFQRPSIPTILNPIRDKLLQDRINF